MSVVDNMFHEANLLSQDFSKWKVDNAISINRMFRVFFFEPKYKVVGLSRWC